MRTVFVLTFALLSGAAFADTVRYPSVPDSFALGFRIAAPRVNNSGCYGA
jgi:hypothetical protein